jgi:TnpA family transposase
MARRRLLSDEQLAPLWAWASDERAIVRHYALSRADLDLIAKKRTASNRLGFAVLMCGMRFPGRVLDAAETPPAAVLAFIADQVGVTPAQFVTYRQRPTNRREHIAELMESLGCRAFDTDAYRELLALAVSLAPGTPRAERLVQSVINEARSRHILLPTPRAIDILCHRARARSEWLLHRALTTSLTDETRKSLDGLLRIAPEMTITRLTWLRNASQSPAPTNILGLIERVEFLRKLGIDRERQQAIPASAFDRIAREALKISAQHFAETAALRRHALLTAAALSLETGLTDATLLMFDKLMGSLSRKAERRSQEKAAKAARDLQEKLRALSGACTAVIRARENRDDPFIAIERQMKMGWSQFVAFVTETESIIAPDKTDPKAEVLRRYATVRKIAPAFLEAFTFKAVPSAKPIMDALDVLKTLYRTGRRSLPAKPPIRFIRRVWRSLVIQGGEIDRKAYELCVFFELRDRPRAGDIWVEGSRQYQDFESYLIPEPTFALLKAEGPLPVAIDTDVESYLAGRRAALDREIEEVGRLADQGKLEGVDLTGRELVISPVRASTPPEAEKKEAVYALLPSSKITDVLLDVDSWTGFTDCFTHQRHGRPSDNKPALLSAILADGINLGLNRMADAIRDVTYRQLALVHDWHIREESYRAALVRLIDAHRALPLASVWGAGRTSSSDGQYFRAGGTGAAIADVNARHGNEPGVSFYTHISDQFGPFYTKVIAASASEAPHVLDGLLYHDTGLAIEEHYTDTGGVTDHVFGLCQLFGFRFAPRIRDIKERKLYLLPDQTAPASLAPLVGGVIDREHIAVHWDQLLRLATSIRTGTTTSSAMLKKLSAYPRQNGLAKAVREIGRIERTLFTLDWIKNPELRRRAHLGLNKGEARNALARAVYFCRLGEVHDRSFEHQFFRASGLNLLVAAIILWNTKYLEVAYTELRRQGRKINEDLLRHVAPLGWEHIGLTGDYVWSTADQSPTGTLRPLRQRQSLLAA